MFSIKKIAAFLAWAFFALCLVIYAFQHRPQSLVQSVRRRNVSLAIILVADSDVVNDQIWSQWLQDFKESSVPNGLVSVHLLHFIDVEKRFYNNKERNKQNITMTTEQRRSLAFVDPRTTLACKRFWWRSASCYRKSLLRILRHYPDADFFLNVPLASVPLRPLKEILSELSENRRSRFCFGKFPVMPRRHSEYAVLSREAFNILESRNSVAFADGTFLALDWEDLSSYVYNYGRETSVFFKDVNLAFFRGLQMMFDGDVDTLVNDGRQMKVSTTEEGRNFSSKHLRQYCPVFDPEFYLASLSDEIPKGVERKITRYRVWCQYCEHLEATINGLDIIDLRNLADFGYWFLGGIPAEPVLKNGTKISIEVLRNLHK